MKLKHWIMVAGLVVSAWLAFFGDRSHEISTVSTVARPAKPQESTTAPPQDSAINARNTTALTASGDAVATTEAASTMPTDAVRILALEPRSNAHVVIGNEERVPSFFASHSWTPPPKPAKTETPPPPSAPPIPFAYIGKQQTTGVFQVYLARGEQTYIVREKAVIDNTYRIDSIKPPTLFLTYLPLNQGQQIFIGATE